VDAPSNIKSEMFESGQRENALKEGTSTTFPCNITLKRLLCTRENDDRRGFLNRAWRERGESVERAWGERGESVGRAWGERGERERERERERGMSAE
jgi:hypothetical protein